MKLMIDIPREDYELVRDKDEFSLTELTDILNTIAKGAPLPEEYQRYKPIILQGQQPCEDCISRKEVLDELDKYIDKAQSTGTRDDFISFQELVVKQLPSVTPSYNSIKPELKPCEDCINRQVVKEMLTAEWTKYMPMELDINLSFVLEKISELPSVTPQTRWIPVSERLPEEAGVYLVSMNRLGYPQREVDGFVCGRWERFGNDVIAWCEIPEPYKESEE